MSPCNRIGPKYALARQDIFRTVQGEGALVGVPMTFVRLAGCSVGCPGCDTDYSVGHRKTATQIADEVGALGCAWSWVTGGEPADRDLGPLLVALGEVGRVAVATSGTKPLGGAARMIDFLSVSPHSTPDELVVRAGAQLNLVPGLNGLRLEHWADFDASGFGHRWVTPCDGLGNVGECLAFVEAHPDWRLGVQAHKGWGLA